ncbi:hypothetical protein [Micromonospora zamorensis]|uniref:hypothetical protein n=1 Tax=Micromonospora zamorensis TaxID=709883 RepID=UPI003F4B3C1E
MRRNPVAIVGAVIVGLFVLVARSAVSQSPMSNATKPRSVPAIPVSNGCEVRSAYARASVSRSAACSGSPSPRATTARTTSANPRPQSSEAAANSRYARRASRSASARSPSSAVAKAATARSVPTAHASPTRSPKGRNTCAIRHASRSRPASSRANAVVPRSQARPYGSFSSAKSRAALPSTASVPAKSPRVVVTQARFCNDQACPRRSFAPRLTWYAAANRLLA